MRRGIPWLAGLLLVAGCSSTDQPDLTPLPKVSHPRAEAPKDRDQQAVLAALRQLDACALAGPTGNLMVVPSGPHRCSLYRDQGDDEIRVTVGALFDAGPRFGFAVAPVGGVKAYLHGNPDFCDVAVPVSFRLAIKVRAVKGVRSTGGGQLCGPAQEFAQHVVTRLVDPDGVRTVLPMADWDACQLLAGSLGDNPDGYRLTVFGDVYGLDGCAGDKERPESVAPAVTLELLYEPDPARDKESVRTVGNRQVRVYDFGGSGGCMLVWSNGRVQSPDPSKTHQVVRVKLPDCARAEAVAVAAMAKLGQGPPAPAAPQRPVTYRPNEPDVGVPGACVDLVTTDDPRYCQPYIEVPVPSGRMRSTLAAEADPNVVCALTREAVAKAFGDRLTPVTAGRECVFVEPTHTIEVDVLVDPRGTLTVGSGEEAVNLSGHPGYRKNGSGPPNPTRELGVSAGIGQSPGTMRFIAQFRAPRGSDSGVRPDVSMADKLDAVVADVLAKYFAE